nr:MAG TPA: PD-(D/E)XK nuclease superfamily protein [Caudoviricetes sp.]
MIDEIWNEERYPLPKSSPCRNCPLKRCCASSYYKKCTTWLAWFAKSWDNIQRQTAKAARI